MPKSPCLWRMSHSALNDRLKMVNQSPHASCKPDLWLATQNLIYDLQHKTRSMTCNTEPDLWLATQNLIYDRQHKNLIYDRQHKTSSSSSSTQNLVEHSTIRRISLHSKKLIWHTLPSAAVSAFTFGFRFWFIHFSHCSDTREMCLFLALIMIFFPKVRFL